MTYKSILNEESINSFRKKCIDDLNEHINLNSNNCSYIIDGKVLDMVLLTDNMINDSKLISYIKSNDCGAISTFYGTTRDNFEGKLVQNLSYEAYDLMALEEMMGVVTRLRSKWDIKRIIMCHKKGDCPVGETSVFIAISSPHRTEALHATEYAINELKAKVPIWKKEIYDTGDSTWKVNKEQSKNTFYKFEQEQQGQQEVDQI